MRGESGRDVYHCIIRRVSARVTEEWQESIRALHVHFIARGDIWPLAAEAELHNVLAVERLSQVAELNRLRLLRFLVWICSWVDRERLVMAQGVDGSLIDKAGTMHRAMVDHLHKSLVLISDRCIVDVNQAIGTSRKQDVVAVWVVLKLSVSNEC